MANILILTPSMAIHGGTRILAEWANQLSRCGHPVTLQICQRHGYRWKPWVTIDFDVAIRVSTEINLFGYDIAVAGFPHAALALDADSSYCRKFFFLQMAEHMFNDDPRWHEPCIRSYQVKMPIIGISKWVEEEVRKFRGDGKMYYVGNGVSSEFVPGTKDEGLTVLVEGWGAYPGNHNKAKDVDMLAPRVAEVLHREYGAKIIAFSQFPLIQLPHVAEYNYILSEYHEAPSGADLVRLYQRPTFMLKASKYDARSCAPVEAMKCGTVTVRAIERGDDDLISIERARDLWTKDCNPIVNSIVTPYDFDSFLKEARLLIAPSPYSRLFDLERRGLEYAARELSWETRMNEIENILLNG